MSAPFMRNPTSCDHDHTTTFSATPYSGASASGQATFTTDNCSALDFSPSFSAIVGGANASMKTSVTTSIDQDLDEAGLVRARIVIPPDLNPDVQLLGNRCSPADFEASVCPPNTIMGSAVAASPLLSQPLAGTVVFVETGATPDIGLDLQGQLPLLLRGTLGLDKVVIFDGLPDIPIAHFELTFPCAPGLLIASREPLRAAPAALPRRLHRLQRSQHLGRLLGHRPGRPADRTRHEVRRRPRRRRARSRAAAAKKKKEEVLQEEEAQEEALSG